MSGDIVLGIKLKVDGKEVVGGVDVSREQFRQLAAEAKKAGDAAAGGFTSAARGVRSISDQLDQAKNAALSYFGATQLLSASRWVVEQASAMQMMDARLKVATASLRDYQAAQAGVFEVANRWGAAVEQTAGAFARLNPVIGQMGGGASTTLKMIDGLSASLRLSGATAGETSAVLLQFSQAMGSGRVGGDEFRSMMESAEPLMRAVAGQLGKTTAELRQMAEEGKLTSSVFGNALLPALDKLKAQAASIPLGVDQAWQVLKNNLSQAFGREFEDSATSVARAIQVLSDNAAPAAAAVHALGYALVEAGKGAAVLGAGAAAAWMAKAGQAAAAAAVAFMSAAAARIAEAEAAATSAAASVTATAAALAEAQTKRALAAEIALYGAQRAAVERELTAAEIAHAASLGALAGAETRLVEARAAGNVAALAGAEAATVARGAMTALGGPIGLVTFALTAGAAAWMAWGGAAETAMARAEKELTGLAKRQRFGSGTLGELKAEQAEAQIKRLEAFSTEGSAAEAEYKKIVDEMAKRAKLIAALEEAGAAAASPAASSNERLSSAGQWGALTKELKWREKLLEEHGVALKNLATSNADRYAEAVAKGVPPAVLAKIARENAAATAAMKRGQRAELNNLPAAKEAAAITEADLDAKGARLKAWHEEYRDTVKRALDESRTDYEGYWALVAAGERHLAEEQLRITEARRTAAEKRGDKPTAIKLGGDIDALRGRLATGIDAETGRGLAHDTGKASEARDEAQTGWSNADTKALATAAAWRRENLSLLDQELAAAREKSAADLRERNAQLAKNEALKHAPELFKAAQQAAADQVATTLTGIEAEIAARHQANSEWEYGAVKALRAYADEAKLSAASVGEAFKQGAKMAEDALANFVVTGKLDIASLARFAAVEMARENFAKPVMKIGTDWLRSLLPGGGSGVSAYDTAGVANGNVGGFAAAKGAVFSSAELHQYADTIVSSPTLFRFARGGAFQRGLMGEAGPEAIMPLRRGPGGRLGVEATGGGTSLTVNLIEAPKQAGQVQQRQEGGQNILDIYVERIRSAIASDITRGSGPVPAALGATYGLNRAAGAY